MKLYPLLLGVGLVLGFSPSQNAHAFAIPQPAAAKVASKLAHIQFTAAQGAPEAQYLLGLLYISGQYLLEERANGAKWLALAAEQGHIKAQRTLADLAYEGKIIARSVRVAERWYLALSEQGNKWAHFRLGFIYASGGKGVPSHCGKAIEQFSLVGDAVSQGNMAWILATCPDAQYRDGEKALALARGLLESDSQDPTYLDNLAAAYAELGDYHSAIATQQKAIDALQLSEGVNRSDEFELRLHTYQQRKPFREVPAILD